MGVNADGVLCIVEVVRGKQQKNKCCRCAYHENKQIYLRINILSIVSIAFICLSAEFWIEHFNILEGKYNVNGSSVASEVFDGTMRNSLFSFRMAFCQQFD